MSFDTGHVILIISAKDGVELKRIAQGLVTLNHQAAVELHEHLTVALDVRMLTNAEKPWTVPKEEG